jgi:hypothetical protein
MFFSTQNFHIKPVVQRPLMTSKDTRTRPGSHLSSLTSKMMRKSDLILYFGSNAVTQTIKGTAVCSKIEASMAGDNSIDSN